MAIYPTIGIPLSGQQHSRAKMQICNECDILGHCISCQTEQYYLLEYRNQPNFFIRFSAPVVWILPPPAYSLLPKQ
jgi:hypothetical protein